MADKNLAQEVDQQGRASGGYSWSMPGGGSASLAYGAGHYVSALMSDSAGRNSMISSGRRQGQYYEPRLSDNSLPSYGAAQYVGTGPAMSDSNVGHGPGQYVGQHVGQYVGSGSTEDVLPQSLERYRPSGPRQAMTELRYNKTPDLTGEGEQSLWRRPASFSGANTNSQMTDSSYLMRILGRDSQWIESSDKVRKV